ncbi:MAG: phosphatidylglycerophosphatase A, partial [Gammaproteobacteria bacterium]
PMQNLGLLIYLPVVAGLLVIGIYLCEKTAKDLKVHDHSAIVWDEIVGYLITMIAAPIGWLWILLGFMLFRLFDIWKPWPIGWVDRRVSGGFGIMLDDVIAGLYGLVILQIIAYLL